MNTFLPREGQEEQVGQLELVRSTEQEKQDQIDAVRNFQAIHKEEIDAAVQKLQSVARDRGNVFEQLIESVKSASLGQVSSALYEVGGEYRRNM